MRMLLALLTLAGSLCAADITGIWSGQVKGRRGETEDISFQFNMKGQKITGVQFGDEFDLPVEEASLTGDQLKFVVTTTNYYSGNKAKVVYTGTVTGEEIELRRERIRPPGETPPAKPEPNLPFKIKKIT